MINYNFPIFAYSHECFQEYKNQCSLVLWCYDCNMRCKWCSMKDVIFDRGLLLYENYLDLIANHTDMETAIVFLGGEPTIYSNALIEGCRFAHSLKLKTKVYTNGNLPEVINNLINLKLLDAVSIDYKEPYKLENSNIEKILKFTRISNMEVDIRTTLHPGLTERDIQFMDNEIKELSEKYYFTYYKQRWINNEH